jgi:hypothetical protein
MIKDGNIRRTFPKVEVLVLFIRPAAFIPEVISETVK